MNKFRRIFNPTPEEMEEDRKIAERIWNECVETKSCAVCSHFYDVTRGAFVDYGCELENHNQYAISNEPGCPDWEEKFCGYEECEQE